MRIMGKWRPQLVDRIIVIWLTGSRVYGTAHEGSDWDYNVIVRTTSPGERPREADVYDDDGTVNLVVYTEEDWKLLTWEHRMLSLELRFTAPTQIVWGAVPQWCSDPLIDLDVLLYTLSWETGLKPKHATRRSKDGNDVKARKLIFLVLRFCAFATRLAQNQPIQLDCAGPLWHSFASNLDLQDPDEWRRVLDRYAEMLAKVKSMRQWADLHSRAAARQSDIK